MHLNVEDLVTGSKVAELTRYAKILLDDML